MLGLLVFSAAGLVAFTKLNIEAYPNPAPVILEITAQAPACPPRRWRQYYTIPMEIGLYPTPGVDIIRSTSFYGLSFVRVTFKYGVDYYFAYTQAAISLQQNVNLPGNQVPQIQQSSLVGEIYRYQVVGPPHFGLTNLRTVQDWIVQRRLLDHPRRGADQQLGRHHQGIRCRSRSAASSRPTMSRCRRSSPRWQRQHQRRRPRDQHRPAIGQHPRRRPDRRRRRRRPDQGLQGRGHRERRPDPDRTACRSRSRTSATV